MKNLETEKIREKFLRDAYRALFGNYPNDACLGKYL